MPIISSKASMSAQAYGLFGVTAAPFTLVGAYDALATITVPSGGASSITFSAIPQTGYSHLQVRVSARTSDSSNGNYLWIRMNGDSGNTYSWHTLEGYGSGTPSAGASSTTNYGWVGYIPGTNVNSNVFGAEIIDILDYANVNKFKTTRALGGDDGNGLGGILFGSSSWQSQSAINSITFSPSTGGANLVAGSTFSLYGIK